MRIRGRDGGQSLTEFALVLPLMLLLLLFGLDFGRVFLGWVELNNVARQAANYAASNPYAWNPAAPDSAAQAQYASLVSNDAAAIDCTLPSPLPTPSFPNGASGPNSIGQPVSVSLTCQFRLMTPLIGGIVGNPLPVAAAAAFPIRYGAIAGIPLASIAPLPSPTPTPTPTPSASSSASPSASASSSPSPTPTPTSSATPAPNCTVPNLLNVKAVNAQATWTAAGFAQPVIFLPLAPATFPPSGGNILTQSLTAGSAQPCGTATIQVTWR